MSVVIGAAIVVLGTMVGLELAVAVVVNPLLRGHGRAVEVASRARGAGALGAVMPFWYFGSLTLVGGALAMSWDTAGRVPLAAATVLMATAIVLTVSVLVPINNRVASWASDSPPSDWRAQLSRWDRGHVVRVGVILAAFILLVAGVLV